MQKKFKAVLVAFVITGAVGVGVNISDARQEEQVALAKFCADQTSEPFKGKLACIGFNAARK